MSRASVVLVLALLAPSVFAQGARDSASIVQAVPVFQEPRHHRVFENSLVRVLDVRVSAGDTTAYHVHANHHIAVVISGARTWDQRAGQGVPKAESIAIPVGTVLDNAIDSIPYTHRVGNADTVAFRYIVGQLLASSGIASPILPASSGMRFDHETLGARVYRATLAPGQSTLRHRHAAPGLTVQVGVGMLRLDGVPPEASSAGSGAGAWWWRGAGSEHVLRNIGARPVDVVEIDWP